MSNLIEEKISAAPSRMRPRSTSAIGELFLNYGRIDGNIVAIDLLKSSKHTVRLPFCFPITFFYFYTL